MKAIPNLITDIIWLQTGYLGDIVIQTAAISVLKKNRPEIRQTLVTTPLGVAALKAHDHLDCLLEFNKRGAFLKSFSEIKRALSQAITSPATTVLLQAHGSYRSSLLAKFLGYFTVTYYESRLSFLSDLRCQRVAVLHEAHRIALLLECLKVDRKVIMKELPYLNSLPLSGEKSWMTLFHDKGPLLAIAPGSVWGTKKWPKESYAELVRRLLEARLESRILLLGSEREVDCCDHIYRECFSGSNGRLFNLAGDTSLDDLRGIYPNLKLLIANDSSPIHYASAFRVPTVAIFGATVPAMGFSPLAPGSIVIENKDLGCRPCSDHGPKVCPLEHFKCMRELSVARVLKESLSTLERLDGTQ